MKKYIQILLVTCLVLSMTACGSTEVDEVVVVEEDLAEDNTTDEVVEDVDATDTTETDEVEETENVEETEEETTGYYPGTFTETGYETEFLGFRFTTPEGCVLATPEELAELMGTTMDALTESGDVTEIQKKYAELNGIYEFMATDSLGAVNVNIVLEKTVLPLNLYVEIIKEQFTNMSEMTITLNSEEEVELAGADYTKLATDVATSDIAMKQDYYFREVEGYIMCITVTWVEGFETELETMMSSFSAF